MPLTVLRSEAEWASLAAEWNALLDSSATDVPFLRHEYLMAWWQHRGGGEWPAESELFIVVARDEAGALVGIAPLFFAPDKTGQPALLLLGSVEISDFLDLIARPEDLPGFITELLTLLTGPDAPAWQRLEWLNLLEDSPTLPALKAAAEAAGLTYTQERLQPAPYIPLNGDFDAWLESIDGKERQELRRKLRNAGRYPAPVSLYRLEDEATFDDEFTQFGLLMKQERGKQDFLTPEMGSQMAAIARAALKAGYLDLRFLTAGKQKAAALFCFDYKNRIWGYNSGLETRFADLSPGAVLLGLTLMDACETNREAFDFMRGDEEYKYRYGGVARWVVRARIER
ncbi:MAG: GNAT family N-acetyltransferase [Anaerolineae bacterium]|nr:MAG: GNAT family N-acetyltransferase [Anaerolineae bacterium]